MSKRLNITVDEDVFEFVEKQAHDNRSAFINKVLREAKRRHLEEQIKAACLEEQQDTAYQDELALWDTCIADGLS
jgi:hypothetical protein